MSDICLLEENISLSQNQTNVHKIEFDSVSIFIFFSLKDFICGINICLDLILQPCTNIELQIDFILTSMWYI